MLKTKKVGLKDIAKNLELSINTVSHALRDLDDISEETKEIVRKEALRLGYQAKGYTFKFSKVYTIALVFDSFRNPYFALMGQMIVDKIEKEKFDLLVINTNEFKKIDEEIIKKCLYRKVDAIISFNEFETKAVELAKLNNIALELIGRVSDNDYVDSLFTDDIKGGEIATSYLISKGSRKLIYVYEIGSEASKRRLIGFLKVIDEYNNNNNNNNNKITYKLVTFKESTLDLYNLIIKENYDGIFFYNDRVLTLFLMYSKEYYELFNKINIIGFDNDIKRLGFHFTYPSIDFDYESISKKAIEILKKRLLYKSNEKANKIKFDVFLNENK